MLPIVSWRVWLTDGSTYDSVRHSWTDVPETGIAALCAYHDPAPYRTFAYGTDEYSLEIFREGFREFPAGGDLVKLGSWMTDEGYASLLTNAHAAVRP